VLTLIAQTAFVVGDVDAAAKAVQEAKKIQSEHGIPALSASQLRQISAKVALAKGELAEAFALLHESEQQTHEANTPLDRLLTALVKAHLFHETGQLQAAAAALKPWIANTSGFEIPVHLRAELLLHAGRADAEIAPTRAATYLADAEKLASETQVPTSPLIAAIRAARKR
jgi:ATP/maltotriose-dependent transcriptional regulator MalT